MMSMDLSLSINNNYCNNLAYASRVLQFYNEFKNPETEIRVNTSGSTGTPKEIILKKEAMMISAKQTIDFFNLKTGQNLLLCLPIDFIAGKMMIVRAILSKANLVIADAVANPLVSFLSKPIPMDFAAFTPYQVSSILEEESTRLLFGKIKTVIIGGGEISPILEKKLSNFNNDIYATYGMTETITHIAVRKINHPIYKTFKGIQLGLDERNCLTISAPYLGSQPIITNDVVEFEGPFEFTWKGRFDNVINTGGIKVHPEITEKKLSDLLKEPFFIHGLNHEQLGQQVVLIIENEPYHASTLHILHSTLRETLDKYEVPKQIFFVKQFAMTPTGKIDRLTTMKYIQ